MGGSPNSYYKERMQKGFNKPIIEKKSWKYSAKINRQIAGWATANNGSAAQDFLKHFCQKEK